ncbi:craniofacial development protein 2-like [Dama dama]|uniref:craniofacial development protein 2-like n=1 Tax=Dama dama TaxID=30532 RepID=UPI002A35E585|nr:craniofacial development protein 2-like [Dama dama]
MTLITGDWNAKVGSQETPGVTGKFGLGVQNEAGQRLIEFCQENTLVIANTLFQHKRRLYTWTSPDGQHQNLTDYILCSQRWRSSIQSAKTRPGADCGSDHEILFAKFRLKLKKVEKTTRPFKYALNQIPYDYTVEVGNRFKGIDLIDRVPDELWNNRLVPNRKRSTSRLYIVTLLFSHICRVHHEKCWAGESISCNPDCQEKYQ